jgi:hypothetical protein
MRMLELQIQCVTLACSNVACGTTRKGDVLAPIKRALVQIR